MMSSFYTEAAQVK